MKPLTAWSARRALLTALAWLIGVPTLAIVVAVVSIFRALSTNETPTSGVVLMPQREDLIVSVAGTELTWLLVFVFGPPTVLLLTWWAARRREHDRPT